jgi:hypothetical protein
VRVYQVTYIVERGIEIELYLKELVIWEAHGRR